MGPIMPIDANGPRAIPNTFRMAGGVSPTTVGLNSGAAPASTGASPGMDAIQAIAAQLLHEGGGVESDRALRMLIGLLILLAVLKALDPSGGAAASDQMGGGALGQLGGGMSGDQLRMTTTELSFTSLTVTEISAEQWTGGDPDTAPGANLDVSA